MSAVAHPVTRFVLDRRRGTVWTYEGKMLTSFHHAVRERLSADLSTLIGIAPAGRRGIGAPLAATKRLVHVITDIAVDENDGTLWLAQNDTLLHLDHDAKLIQRFTLPEKVLAVTVDTRRNRIWAATNRSLLLYKDDGTLDKEISFPRTQRINDLTYDPLHQRLWLAAHNELRIYDHFGRPVKHFPIPHALAVSPDSQGGAWLHDRRHLKHLTNTGTIDISMIPFGTSAVLGGLTVDLSDDSVWLANNAWWIDNHQIIHVSVSGERIATLSSPRIHDNLATLAKTFQPRVALEFAGGSRNINTRTPAFTIHYTQALNQSRNTLTLLIGEQTLSARCRWLYRHADCTPVSPLPEGMLTITARIEDHHGNGYQSSPVSLYIDTSPPTVTFNHPVDGIHTNDPILSLSGHVSEPSTLHLSDQTYIVDNRYRFNLTTQPLTEGLNAFSLTATDRAGNRFQKMFSVFLDTRPPKIPNPLRILIVPVDEKTVAVNGQPESVEPNALVSIYNARTNEDVVVHADDDGSFQARIRATVSDPLYVRVSDRAGNSTDYIALGR